MTWSSATCAEKAFSRKRRAVAALDLGTNNCRLMIAVPRRSGFAVVATFSRIVRLGEGIVTTGRIAGAAEERAIAALKICAEMIARWDVAAMRCVTTEACRSATNGEAFVERVRRETGLRLDVIGPTEEARLALLGCLDLIDKRAERAVLFDIGGGSTELCFLQTLREGRHREILVEDIVSLPFGVVRLSEGLGEGGFAGLHFQGIRRRVAAAVRQSLPDGFSDEWSPQNHLLGTSGTSTSLAAFHKGMKRYRRREVDGSWLNQENVRQIAAGLEKLGFQGRCDVPAIGEGRADLIMPGCAILQGILDATGFARLRVADRGLREGLVYQMLEERLPVRARKRPALQLAEAVE